MIGLFGGGGKRPVDCNQIVEVKFRDLDIDTDMAECYSWTHEDNRADIIAYRVVK